VQLPGPVAGARGLRVSFLARAPDPTALVNRYANPSWGVAKVLAPQFYYTGPRTCMTDALAFIFGYAFLSEEDANAIGEDPQIGNSFCCSAVQLAMHDARVVVRRIKRKAIRMETITGQREGLFLVRYTGAGEQGELIRHCVAIDCMRRIAFCNQNGVYPFCLSDDGRAETPISHTKLKELLGVSKITQAYRVLVAVDAKSGVNLRRPRATAPPLGNKRQRQM